MSGIPPHPVAPVEVRDPQRALLIVISGPSGVGKTTITHRLVERLHAAFSVSMTTRPPAAKDRDGVDYYFVTPQRFQDAVDRGELLEWAKVFENHYGTPRRPVEEHLAANRDVVLEIDVSGAIQIKRGFPDAVTIFILPPSEQELLSRLRGRGREEEAVIQKRFAEAQREIQMAKESGAYDHFVVNDQLDETVEEACRLIRRRKQC